MPKQIFAGVKRLNGSLFEQRFAETVHSVSEINGYVKEKHAMVPVFGNLRIRGEISNCVKNTKGHIYFSLKDERSVIKAVIFAGSASNLKIKPENGMKVIAGGRLTVYEAGGVYQIVVSSIEADGKGALYEAYEKLKNKLEKEGLFSEKYKKKLPRYPMRIGVITSPTGAAVRDIVRTAGERWPVAEIVIYPATVQGIEAEGSLIRGVRYFEEEALVDVVIIGRGGGSIEDLWAFNSEALAREIANGMLPYVSAVGHETDFTICDFVCSVRAATPTGAAVAVTPQISEITVRINSFGQRAEKAIGNKLSLLSGRLTEISGKKVMRSPRDMIEEKLAVVNSGERSLNAAIGYALKERCGKISEYAGKLTALNPLSVLSRGYGAVFDSNGRILTEASEIRAGQKISVRMRDGKVDANVTSVEAINPKNS